MVSVIQTFGERVNPHPHVHALVSRGGWTRDDRFVPVPYVDPLAAQRLFRHEVFAFLGAGVVATCLREVQDLILPWQEGDGRG